MYLHSSDMHKKIIDEQKRTKISYEPKNSIIITRTPKNCTRIIFFIYKNTFEYARRRSQGQGPNGKDFLQKLVFKFYE